MRWPEAEPRPAVEGARVAERLEALWQIALGPGGGADRPAYSSAEAEAMRLVAEWSRLAGLEPALDPCGNLWALPMGAGDEPVVTSGSHVDTVPDGGRYDGALGTVLALEAAAAPAGTTVDGHPRAVLVCCAEEAPRFGGGTIGSRSLVGELSERELALLRDAQGTSALAARAAYLDALSDLPRLDEPPLGRVAAHVEVHVEQRRELRRRGARLGVVDRVAAPHRYEVTIEGEAGHAGEVAMADRCDALCAAAELVLALEAAARGQGPETVATAGRLSVQPGAVSIVPGRATVELEVRGTEAAAIAVVEEALGAACDRVGTERGVDVHRRTLRRSDPVALDPGLADAAQRIAERLGIPVARTFSGAGHDAQHLAALTRVALLFVPLAGGESHTPEEQADAEEIALAGEVLVDLLAEASSRG